MIEHTSVAGFQVRPMREDRRVVHIRKHLLNPREAFWQLATGLTQAHVRETARRFTRSGVPCGRDAGRVRLPESDPRALECHALHDDHYAPVYDAALQVAAAGHADAFEFGRLSDGTVALRITHSREALVVVASGHGPLFVRTAYRTKNVEDAVRKHRAQASLEVDAEGDDK